MPGLTTARGYGWRHQQARRAALARLSADPGQPCSRCGAPMFPGQLLDLDHSEDRAGYLGLAHRRCNRSAGAVKGNARRGRGRAKPITSRDW
ncbi:hypothetical protein [Actinomadura sp. 9N215]|uniref:hypothetical protein n=1 Tax=Actinomadura sp. 9N215 TaxID=3375150 RepID=UPI0037A389A5